MTCSRVFGSLLVSMLMAGVSPAVLAQVASPNPGEQRVQVHSFRVTGNTLLPTERLLAVLAAYTGARTAAELNQAALAVQAQYREAGYGAVVAYLPEQNTAGGEILVAVLEGRIAKVTISGARQFSEANIRASVPSLMEGQTPRVLAIDNQIQIANDNPAKKLDVSLRPGAQPGEVDARIDVTEQPVTRWTLGLDNTGNAQTGRWRTTLGWTNAGLWNRDHVMTLQVQTAPEHVDRVAVLGANYRIPFYAQGMALDAYVAYSEVDGGTTATSAGPLQFSGKGRVAGLRLTQSLPRLGEFEQRLVAGLDYRDYINNCNIVGLPTGACGPAGESVSVQPLSLDYVLQRGGPQALSASIGLQHNLQLGGGHAGDAQFAAVRPGAAPNYTVLRYGLSTALALPAQWQLQARLAGQASHDALVPGEQFGLGGATSVRGYNEREVTGDSGAAGSVELYTPELLARSSASVRLLGFVDAGAVHNRLGTACQAGKSSCSLSSFGFGARYVHQRLTVRFDLAQARREGNLTRRDDVRAHVFAIYSL